MEMNWTNMQEMQFKHIAKLVLPEMHWGAAVDLTIQGQSSDPMGSTSAFPNQGKLWILDVTLKWGKNVRNSFAYDDVRNYQ